MIELVLAPALTKRATSFSASSLNLVFKSFKVNLVPYLPANGEVLTLTETPIKGWSIFKHGITF
jgi:hypothetical protein